MILWLLGHPPAALALAVPLILFPCGPVPEDLLAHLSVSLPRFLPVKPAREAPVPLPAAACHALRRQYRADHLLDLLSPAFPAPPALALVVTDVDLYVPPLNFVFGLADPGKRAAVISLTRLTPEYYGQPPHLSLWRQRVLKEAVHELGHLFGLGHCPKPSCIMFFSNTLGDTDFKGPDFCPHCRRRLTPSTNP